jgi:hypothetical protein
LRSMPATVVAVGSSRAWLIPRKHTFSDFSWTN